MFIRRILFAAVMALAPVLVAAQATDNDYYQARATPQTTELLTAVEKYHLQPGIDKMRSKFYSAAWGDFNFILNYFPNHPRALMLMAELCDLWRNPKCNMGPHFDKALQRTPESEGLHLTKGAYLQKRGRLDEAIESYKRSLAINPSSAYAHYNLGLAYAAKKQFSIANEHAQQAYELGDMPAGLREKLLAARAWKPGEKKPVMKENASDEAVPAKADADSAHGPRDKPAATIGEKPLEPNTKRDEKTHQ